MLAEADSLVKAAFGSTMLRAIGKTYSSQAEIFLGNFFEGSIAAIKSKSSSMKSQMHALGLAIQVQCLSAALFTAIGVMYPCMISTILGSHFQCCVASPSSLRCCYWGLPFS